MRALVLTVMISALAVTACGAGQSGSAAAAGAGEAAEAGLAKATFAGGCFWCMEPPFDELEGVVSTTSGYTAGHVKNPTYEQVSAGVTGHTEAVEILYDPRKISYRALLDVFWRNVDPLAVDRQFCDAGTQYRTGIYTHDEEQRRLAEETAEAVARDLAGEIATEIQPVSEFYPAEEYHQDYYRKNPVRYKLYRQGCGRDRRLKELWGED